MQGWRSEELPVGLSRGAIEPICVWDTGRGMDLDLVFIEPGDFIMGSDGGAADEGPMYTRLMKEGYWIGRTHVTWGEFRVYCKDMKLSEPPAPPWGIHDEHPVTNITWHEAGSFARWAGLRLPMEAEWEKAARGVDGRLYPWGDEPPTPERCVWKGHPNFGRQSTAPVGSFPAGQSPYGAMDMAGNAWEWCADVYDPKAHRRGGHGRPPAGAASRVYRGGGLRSKPSGCTCTKRAAHLPLERHSGLGFRVVLGGDM